MAGLGRGGPKKGTSSRAVTETWMETNTYLIYVTQRGAYGRGRLEQNRDDVPYTRHCQSRRSPPAPQHRHAGSWRQSCLAQMECSRLETRWLRCHFLCAFFSVAAITGKALREVI